MPPDEINIAELVRELNEATSLYDAAVETSRVADIEKTAAQNRLNKAQQAISLAIDGLRNRAPIESYWQDERRRER